MKPLAMTNRLQAAIAAVSQLSELEQDAIASLILEKIRSTKLTMPASQESKHQPIRASDPITGLFADEPELMAQIMQSIEHDRDYDRRRSFVANSERNIPDFSEKSGICCN
jgi:hypothetical protein